MAAEWGVSRAEIVRRCGAVKTDQELEDERKLRQLEKFEEKVQNAGFVKKESHLEKQIAQAEGCLDQLSEYEKMRLENMKERQALLEELDIDQEKKEIAVERQKSMIFTPKEEVSRRAPSARVKALKEQNSRMLEEQMKVQYQGMVKQVSPKWVGQWLPLRTGFRYSKESALQTEDLRREVNHLWLGFKGHNMMELDDVGMACSVPRGKLNFGEIEEQFRKPHASLPTMESITAELNELVEEPSFTSSGAILSELEMENENVVSTSAITSMRTCWDFVGFGTAEGGVGVSIGAANMSWRPHSAEVTGIAFCGGSSNLGILSSSMDGAVRRSDLARQSVLLEYQENDEGIGCLVKRNQSEFLLGSDSTVRLLDLRERRVSSLLRQGGSRIALHPTDSNLLALGGCIYDLRQTKSALLKLQSQVSSLQWSPNSGEQLLAVVDETRRVDKAKLYSMEQLLRGEEGLIFTQKITEPLAAQWSPWSEATLLLSGKSSPIG